MSNIKLSEVAPWLLLVPREQLVSIPIKNIPNVLQDDEPTFRRGKKILKRWYTNQIDRIINKPAFCKTYEYIFDSQGRLSILTKTQWFDEKGGLYHEENFRADHSIQATDVITKGHRETIVSRLRSDARGISGVNGKGDAVRIFNRYKTLIETYIFDKDAAQDWVDAMDNETRAGILNLLNVILPALYIDNVYETALSEDRLFPILLSRAEINPFNTDFSPKDQIQIATELAGKGVDISDPSTAVQNIVAYLNSEIVNSQGDTIPALDVRFISIKQVITEVITTD